MRDHLKYVVKSYKQLQRATDSTDEALAWKCLLEHVTYRLDKTADQQPTIGFRVLWRTLRKIRSGVRPDRLIEGGDPGHIIFEARVGRIEQKVHYIARQHTTKPGVFVSKEDAPAWLAGQGLILPYLAAVLPIAIRCAFQKKHRANRALHILHIAELTALRAYFSSRKPAAIYDFAPYHIDSNWQYLVHRTYTENYYKLPSPGPLKTHNAITLCDTLITSSGYHDDELRNLPQVRVKHRLKWLVENAFNYIDRYASGDLPEPQAFTLGYYSHGSWIRKEAGHRDDGLNIHYAEEEVLKALATILAHTPHYRLVVFPHPREKKPEQLERTRAHYSKVLNGCAFEFSNPDQNTASTFETVDVAVAAFSTIVYERLFCGYKMLLGNYGIPSFPVEGSPLRNICFQSEEQLKTLLERAFDQSRSDFFAKNGLQHYRFDSYAYFKERESQ